MNQLVLVCCFGLLHKRRVFGEQARSLSPIKPPPVSPASVPVKVQFEFETIEEFLEFFETLKGNEPKTKVTISEATVSATPEWEAAKEEVLTASKPVSKPRKLAPIRCRTCEVDLNSDNWYASMQKKNARQCKRIAGTTISRSGRRKRERPLVRKPRRRINRKGAHLDGPRKSERLRLNPEGPPCSEEERQTFQERSTGFQRPTSQEGVKKAKKSPKQKKTASTKKKEPTLNLKFESAYAVVNSQIRENSQASVKGVIEALVVSDDEREMMEGIVLKLLRGAATHSPNLFGVGEGKNPTLLCFGPRGHHSRHWTNYGLNEPNRGEHHPKCTS